MVPMATLPKKNKKKRRGCIISLNNPLYQVWRILNILIVFTSSFFFAYQSAFLNLEPEEDFQRLQKVDLFIEGLYAFDIIICFFVEYRNPSTDERIRDNKAVARMYFEGRFPFDLIATIPFVRLFSEILSRKYLRLMYWLKLFRLALLIHLLLYKNFMKQIR